MSAQPETPITQSIYTAKEVLERIPLPAEYWVSHNSVLLQGDKRLPDYRERINNYGGVETLQDWVKGQHIPRGQRRRFLFLVACQEEPLTLIQAARFVEDTNFPGLLGLGSVYGYGTRLRDRDILVGESSDGLKPRYEYMKEVNGLVTVERRNDKNPIDYSVKITKGYLSTSQQIRAFRDSVR